MPARILAGCMIAAGFERVVTRQIQTAYVAFLRYQGRPVAEVMMSYFHAPGELILMQAAQMLGCAIGGDWIMRLNRRASWRDALIGGMIYLAMAVLSNVLPFRTTESNWAVSASLLSPIPGFLPGALLARSALSPD